MSSSPGGLKLTALCHWPPRTCFTCKNAPGSIDEADARLRTDKGAGKPVAMPKKAAWSTMDAIP